MYVLLSYIYCTKKLYQIDTNKSVVMKITNRDGKNPPPLQGQDGNLSMFTPEMYLPKPRVATHARYRGKNDPKILKYTEVLNLMFQRGAESFCWHVLIDANSHTHTYIHTYCTYFTTVDATIVDFLLTLL